MNWFRNVFKSLAGLVHQLSPSCKDATRLQSAALDRPLKPPEKFGLRTHLMICKWCHAYGKQIRFLSSASKSESCIEHKHAPPTTLSPEARERIKRSLQTDKK
jgi:hypothetical protein